MLLIKISMYSISISFHIDNSNKATLALQSRFDFRE